jgi:hypothetical protein
MSCGLKRGLPILTESRRELNLIQHPREHRDSSKPAIPVQTISKSLFLALIRMASQQSQGPLVPKIQLSQSSAVDFIDTRLPAYHAAFNHPHARFDAGRQRFVDNSLTPKAPKQPARPVAPQIESMAFWSDMLPNAMIQLSTTPETDDRKQSDYSIRSLKTWEEIREKLELAKVEYGYLESGAKDKPKFGNRLKSSTRKILDGSVGPLQQAVGFVPNIELASPVTTTVKMLLDVRRL